MPSNLTFEQADALMKAGWQVRRYIDADTGLAGQLLPAGARPLRWYRLHRDADYFDNARWVKSATVDRIVIATVDSTAGDFTLADSNARDWTTDPPELPVGVSHTAWTHPNAARAALAASGGSSGSSGSGGGGGGSYGSSGGVGGSGSSSLPRRRRPAREAPALTVTVSRVSAESCVMRDTHGEPTLGPISDDFTCHVAFADQTGFTGQLWAFSVRWACNGHGGPVMNGNLAVGSSQDGAFTVPSAPKGADVIVVATAFLYHSALSAQGTGHGAMRSDCAECPEITSITPPAAQFLTAGDSLSVSVSASTPAPHVLTYEWFDGGGTSIGTGSTLSYGPIWALGLQTFNVTIRSDCGREETRPFDVTVSAPTCGEHQHYDEDAHACVYDDGYCGHDGCP